MAFFSGLARGWLAVVFLPLLFFFLLFIAIFFFFIISSHLPFYLALISLLPLFCFFGSSRFICVFHLIRLFVDADFSSFPFSVFIFLHPPTSRPLPFSFLQPQFCFLVKVCIERSRCIILRTAGNAPGQAGQPVSHDPHGKGSPRSWCALISARKQLAGPYGGLLFSLSY